MLSRAIARARGRALSSSYTIRPFTASAGKERLVILGSGWGGYGVLRSIDRKRYDVTVVSPSNYFNFTPLLASAAVGTLEFRCATEAVRHFSPEVDYHQAWCDEIDFERKTLVCMPAHTGRLFGDAAQAIEPARTRSLKSSLGSPETPDSTAPGKTYTIPYDKLIISVGAYSQTFNIPGVKEHAFFLKDVKDSRRIRAKIMDCLEQASQPFITPEERSKILHFCIVGGGPTGIEFAAELYDFIQKDVARAMPHLLSDIRISLYDVAPHILSTFDAKLAHYAEDKFRRRGIELLTGHHVERVEAQKLHVKEQGEVPFGLLVWSTGLAPNPLVASVGGLLKDSKTSSLITSDHLNVLKQDKTPDLDVWAIGDAAQSEGQVLPATAQVAYQKARYLVRKLNRSVRGQASPEPFIFRNQGALAYLGSMTAIVDRSRATTGAKTSASGFFAWLLWRSAYFTMTVSYRNKILIPIYWTLTMLFGRDLTRF